MSGKKPIKCPVLYLQFVEKLTFWKFLLEKHTGLLGKKVKIVHDMQAHFEEKITFFGRKVNKVPKGAIWGKINFLRIFGVRTNWIIGQISGAFLRKKSLFLGGWELRRTTAAHFTSFYGKGRARFRALLSIYLKFSHKFTI